MYICICLQHPNSVHYKNINGYIKKLAPIRGARENFFINYQKEMQQKKPKGIPFLV
jgi:hypothetical protein